MSRARAGVARGPGGRSRSGALPGWVAAAAVAALAAIFALRRIDDFDTWWHLAAGRWMVEHLAITRVDVLSHTVRGHPWTNLEWGFQAALYLLHAAGGPVLLCAVAALAYALAVGLLYGLVRPHLGPVGGGIAVLAVVLAIQDRFTVRPELATFPLLVALLAVLDRGRRREGSGLWLLAPLMIVWVNVHGLFVVGVLGILCALAGSFAGRIPLLPRAIREVSRWEPAAERALRIWGGAALMATLVNPYGLRGVLLPVKLFTLIDESSPALQSIAEFRSPFSPDVGGIAVAVYKILLGTGIAAVLAALVVSLRRMPGAATGRTGRVVRGGGGADAGGNFGSGVVGFDLGPFAFFAGLAALSVIARRNGALFALGAAPFAASCAGTVLRALPARWGEGLRRSAPFVAGVLLCGVLLLGGSVVTGSFYRWDNQPREFGAGVLEGSFPVRAAAFAREAKLPARLYNDVAAGGYLAWDDPIGEGVFIDGRLEVYDTPFFAAYVAAMYDQRLWEAEADRLGIQTAIIYHHWENRRLLVERLVRSGTWSLVYADEVAAVFVRARGNGQALARADAIQERYNRATAAWLDRPVPAWGWPAGRIEGTRAFARLLATIGDADGAAEQFSRLIELGVSKGEELDVRLRLARHYLGTGRGDRGREELQRILAIDPGNREAGDLLRGGAAAR